MSIILFFSVWMIFWSFVDLKFIMIFFCKKKKKRFCSVVLLNPILPIYYQVKICLFVVSNYFSVFINYWYIFDIINLLQYINKMFFSFFCFLLQVCLFASFPENIFLLNRLSSLSSNFVDYSELLDKSWNLCLIWWWKKLL